MPRSIECIFIFCDTMILYLPFTTAIHHLKAWDLLQMSSWVMEENKWRLLVESEGTGRSSGGRQLFVCAASSIACRGSAQATGIMATYYLNLNGISCWIKPMTVKMDDMTTKPKTYWSPPGGLLQYRSYTLSCGWNEKVKVDVNHTDIQYVSVLIFLISWY